MPFPKPSEPMSLRKKIVTETRVISVTLPMMINIAEVARPLAGAVVAGVGVEDREMPDKIATPHPGLQELQKEEHVATLTPVVLRVPQERELPHASLIRIPAVVLRILP